MFWQAKDKPKERYYLLPGMGGRAMRRKQRIMLQSGIAAGVIVSAIVGIVLYLISRGR
jgi:hypothetical protein